MMQSASPSRLRLGYVPQGALTEKKRCMMDGNRLVSALSRQMASFGSWLLQIIWRAEVKLSVMCVQKVLLMGRTILARWRDEYRISLNLACKGKVYVNIDIAVPPRPAASRPLPYVFFVGYFILHFYSRRRSVLACVLLCWACRDLRRQDSRLASQ